MKKLLFVALATLMTSSAALAVEPTIDDEDYFTPMAEDQCSRYGDCDYPPLPPKTPPQPPRPKPRN